MQNIGSGAGVDNSMKHYVRWWMGGGSQLIQMTLLRTRVCICVWSVSWFVSKKKKEFHLWRRNAKWLSTNRVCGLSEFDFDRTARVQEPLSGWHIFQKIMPLRNGDFCRILRPNTFLSRKSPLHSGIVFATPRSDCHVHLDMENF